MSNTIAANCNRPQAEEELALVRRIAQGDRVALERLYAVYHRRLFGFLIRFADRPDLVEEIINDTLFTVWRKAGGFRAQSTVSTWVIGIAYRRALQSLKRLDRWRRMESNVYDPLAQTSSDSGEETGDWLAHGLAQLPLEQRMALELAYFFGHSCEEIAALTDCPVNTVKTRMFNARRRLRALLPELAKETGADTALRAHP